MPTKGKIHILGLGNLGRLFAHALANSSLDPPPVTLLFHRSSLIQDWDIAGKKIEITTNGIPNSNGDYDLEVISSRSKGQQEMIDNLIVTTKTTKTLEAIRSVKERLSHESTVLFCQNGMGTVDEINSHIFPDPNNRPQFLAGIASHGVYSTAPFKSVHAGLAHVAIGRMSEKASNTKDNAAYLISKVVNAKALNAREVDSQELLYLQLEKLAVNVILNPLTALLRCKNGELFASEKPDITRLTRALLDETSQVFRSLPETVKDRSRFGPDRLETRVRDVAEKTAGNTSSMLQDVLAGRDTEIDFINGWIVRKGKELDLNVRNNERIVELVKERFILPVQDIDGQFKALK